MLEKIIQTFAAIGRHLFALDSRTAALEANVPFYAVTISKILTSTGSQRVILDTVLQQHPMAGLQNGGLLFTEDVEKAILKLTVSPDFRGNVTSLQIRKGITSADPLIASWAGGQMLLLLEDVKAGDLYGFFGTFSQGGAISVIMEVTTQ